MVWTMGGPAATQAMTGERCNRQLSLSPYGGQSTFITKSTDKTKKNLCIYLLSLQARDTLQLNIFATLLLYAFEKVDVHVIITNFIVIFLD